ncbi:MULTISPECIES: hypothetical protein [Aliivibrio]|uniref:DUF1566 domain-containing protein n=1 Tax=Aliivibrio finisterrensis TaxID=511998 RepID=A0A4Q5KUN0_9GAMM|nr:MULTISPECIES: hypothetical protein [Aliivibrio]MDD9177760.1 hypothetical protein [Aliivibrio sp. A6]RYU50276.1 hypothetical protein ERW56_15130 [Aliivibrio finisterrensis]RYU51891.1 hypothetical protein ERW57_08235 [Aliivibrio finisterrensis]RYU56003.1 hypothetical protein ERW50_15185 [Aliivibrio finisterrensis]RYU64712.1 hypothetical protein ERW53_08920 [Aliivibrio finisterrensis]
MNKINKMLNAIVIVFLFQALLGCKYNDDGILKNDKGIVSGRSNDLISISISAEESQFYKNGTYTIPIDYPVKFKAIASYIDGSTEDISSTVSWEYSGSNTISSSLLMSGIVQGNQAGETVELKAAMREVDSDIASIQIELPTIVKLEVSHYDLTTLKSMSILDYRQLFAIAYYNNKEKKVIENDITWSVSNNNVSISDTGLMHGVSPGVTDITVENFDGIVSQPLTFDIFDPTTLFVKTYCATEFITINHNGINKTFMCPQYDAFHGDYFYEFGSKGSYLSITSLYGYDDAVNYCNAFNDGYRLPTLEELQALLGTVSIDYSSINKKYGFYFYYGWSVSLPYWTSSRPGPSSNNYFLYMRDTRSYSVAANADDLVYVTCVK